VGYFAISQFALLEILLCCRGMEHETNRKPFRLRRTEPWLNGAIRWRLLPRWLATSWSYCQWPYFSMKLFRKTACDIDCPPIDASVFCILSSLGFGVGTLLYWIYGLSISRACFWQEPRPPTHLIDRVLHNKPTEIRRLPKSGGGFGPSFLPAQPAICRLSLGGTLVPLIPAGGQFGPWRR